MPQIRAETVAASRWLSTLPEPSSPLTASSKAATAATCKALGSFSNSKKGDRPHDEPGASQILTCTAGGAPSSIRDSKWLR